MYLVATLVVVTVLVCTGSVEVTIFLRVEIVVSYTILPGRALVTT